MELQLKRWNPRTGSRGASETPTRSDLIMGRALAWNRPSDYSTAAWALEGAGHRLFEEPPHPETRKRAEETLLGTVTYVSVHATRGEDEWEVADGDDTRDQLVDAITVKARIRTIDGTERTLEAPGPMAFVEPYPGTTLDGSGVMLSKSVTSVEDATTRMVEAMFEHNPGRYGDETEDEYRKMFTEQASAIATTLIDGPAAGRRHRLKLAAARVLKPLAAPSGTTIVTIQPNGDVLVAER